MGITEQDIIQKTFRVPRGDGPRGDGSPVARQMDSVLVSVGFKASRELLEHISTLAAEPAMNLAIQAIGAARQLVGDHVTHNPYFIDFPRNVPDTLEFWASCLRKALVPAGKGVLTNEEFLAPLRMGLINLLDLPGYGTVQHSYQEMLARHDELIPSVKDRVTVLHLGGTLEEETQRLYRQFAASPTPLGEQDLQLLSVLTDSCLTQPQPDVIPVRENRAVINGARLAADMPLVAIDTVTDVLRLACQASDGDPTLLIATRFKSFSRGQRRILLAALNGVIANNRGKLGDVVSFQGPWKRLGERLHPHEYPQYPHAAEVFSVARGEKKVSSLMGRAESAFQSGDFTKAAEILGNSPGSLMRSLDRLLRQRDESDVAAVLSIVESKVSSVSSRVLCSVREHLSNRGEANNARVFVTRSRRAWVTPDERAPLDTKTIRQSCELIDRELTTRMRTGHIVVDPDVLKVALPLSGRATEGGLGILPRGTTMPVQGEVLRFFTYWRQSSLRTDFDLSVLLLDKNFEYAGQVSWTNYHGNSGAVYSGDITNAPNGATEFIDVPLDSVTAAYIVPQVNIYSGEGFDEVAESMFGWMTRSHAQKGSPFEPSMVRARSEMRGSGRVALPMMFGRQRNGSWSATWTHLYLSGSPNFNRVEGNRVSAGLLARSIHAREYLTVDYIVGLMRDAGARITTMGPGVVLDSPVTYIGLDHPEGLPVGSEIILPANLGNLLEVGTAGLV